MTHETAVNLIQGFFTAQEWDQLVANGHADEKDTLDPVPVVKLFTPDAGATWLLTEIEEDGEEFLGFGLCDLGLGAPELGYVSLSELREIRGGLRLPVEKDLHFRTDKRLSELAAEAHRASRITV